MALFKPDAPTPPSPTETARASTSTNVATGVANAFLNNVNQVTPEGSLRYDPTGSYSWTDPTTNSSYNIPTFTATQSLSPQQQAIADQNYGAEYNLAGMANQQSGKLSNLLGQPFDYNNAPGQLPMDWLYDNPWAKTSYGDVGQQQRGIGDAGAITKDYGPADNFSADRSRVEESLYGRLNPQLQLERANIEQRLADQGIRYGSQAYTNAMDDYSRQANDARLAVTQTAGQEQQRLNDMAAQRAGFQNAAQQQNYQQMLQSGTFANQAQQQAYQQEALRAQFYNAGAAQEMSRDLAMMGEADKRRSQYLTEQTALRNQPINEITALMSGSQVQQPNFVSNNQNSIANTDIAGLINNRFSQDMDSYKQQSANFNSLMGGIFGAMGGLAKSDRREKEDIERMGTVLAATPEGEDKKLPIYAYDYKNDDPDSTRHIGPMAQDVERIDKKAVKTIKGVKYIDKTRLGSILKVA